jgi:hypothetical protein
MPTIWLDTWVWEVPGNDEGHLPKNAIRIENIQVLEEGKEPSDRRANAELRKAIDEAGKLINARSVAETEE